MTPFLQYESGLKDANGRRNGTKITKIEDIEHSV
jgi:hypothetical protein